MDIVSDKREAYVSARPAARGMLVAVLGAGGRSGRMISQAALAAGHRVAGLVHRRGDAGALPGAHPIVGDAADPAAVGAAIRGADAVISAIGPGPDSSTTFGTDTMTALLEAAEFEHVARVVVLSGALIGGGELPWSYRMMLRFMKTHDRAVLDDRRRAEAMLMTSPLRWTIVRPPRLTDGAGGGKVLVGEDVHLTALSRVSRATLARFVTTSALEPEYARRAVRVVER